MSLVGPESTSEEWQLHESGIAVWPIGAHEQHGKHLPLETDTIQAVYFARVVAEKLDGALLPALPYGTSMEHKGFRGTITLTPDLLMGLVRQMVTELEAQSFTRLILVNGHGGNFCLSPVVREINRMDRSIKIIMVNPWEFRDHSSGIQPEIHAGESETSIMLALGAPVGDDRCDCDPFSAGIKQSDLNTFGVGRVSNVGTWGFPSRATKAKGGKIVATVNKNMIAFIKERLALLTEDPRYGGPGPVALRRMREDDLPFGLSLSRAAHWNQLLSDWQMYLRASNGGSYVAMYNGKKAGTVATINYGNLFSWIGMVLVDPAIRRCGVGSQLLNKAIEYSSGHGAIGLDATPDGQKLYQTLGFKDYCRLSRMSVEVTSKNLPAPSLNCVPITATWLKKVFSYDEGIFGANREGVLSHLHENNKRYSFVFIQDDRVCGYCMGRSGHDFEQVGPIIADNDDIAQALLLKSLTMSRKKSVLVDCIDDKDDFYQLLNSLGFEVQRPFVRMFLGEVPKTISMEKQFAISGPELG